MQVVLRRLTTVSLSSSSSQQDAKLKFPFSFPEEKGTKALTAEADTLTIPHMQRQQPASMEVGQTNPQREKEGEKFSRLETKKTTAAAAVFQAGGKFSKRKTAKAPNIFFIFLKI